MRQNIIGGNKMAISKEDKQLIIKDFAIHEGDTGSVEVQIAILTNEIFRISEHLKEHKKDHHTRRGLLKKVSRRKHFLSYLKDNNIESYRNVVSKLGLRH